ncbi:N-acetyltransferase [Amphritea balenae]|uniref:N-acetyltransferase n=2 Tax=Amphritea balenae TaxID=452629 RepID=A0A3P1SQQ9_9GAMM|nr:N-acetyltransferase [Amphritea balenae]
MFPRPLSGHAVDNPPPALVPSRICLEGRYVILEPMRADRHAEALYQAGHSTEQGLKIWDYLAYGPWPDLASYTAVIKQQSASQDTVFYALRSKETGDVCGQASFLDINAVNGVIEIGHIWFGPQLQKTRAATEALYLMIRYAMDELGYRRMQWRCNSQNSGSRTAAQRLGFRFEGIFFNHMIFKGKNRDTAWYSILDNEWPTVRELISTWLKEGNFDAEGAARTSLMETMLHRGPDAWARS